MNRRDFIASVMAAATTQVAMAEEPTSAGPATRKVIQNRLFDLGYDR